jgi:general secretion pathway protein C
MVWRQPLERVSAAVGFNDNRPMQSNSHSSWGPRLAAFVLAALAAASAVYWALKWPGTGAPTTPAVVATSESAPADPQALARALGGGSTGVPAAANLAQPGAGSRLSLVGVVANRRAGGAALISVDGKPARPYRVGSRIENDLVLLSVAPRSALLAPSADSPASVKLEMQPLKK